MAINDTLLNDTLSMKNAYEYGLDVRKVKDLLLIEPENRRNDVIGIINAIIIKHGKEDILSILKELTRVEHGIRELEEHHRDNLVHALLCFVLGIYLNERLSDKVSYFEWKLSALLHDICYPIQIANNIMKSFENEINNIKNKFRINNPFINLRIVQEGLDNLSNGINSFDLIQRRINEWELDIHARYEYGKMIYGGQICHGVMSSLLLNYLLDLMYQKRNPKREYKEILENNIKGNIDWNQKFFENEVISICSAIFIHSLPVELFKNTKIKRDKAKLAFLLRLTDCLQDWERPSHEETKGISATNYDIKIENQKLIYAYCLSSENVMPEVFTQA